jgi:hypothetical protein
MQLSAEYQHLAELLGGYSVLWLTFTGWWVLNTSLNERHTKPLQSLMTYALVFKCLYVISACGA